MNLKEWIQFLPAIITVLGTIFFIYKYFSDPDTKNNEEIKLIKQGCGYRHTAVDKDLSAMSKTLSLIQENELRHIESDIRLLQDGQVKLFQILEERLPRK